MNEWQSLEGNKQHPFTEQKKYGRVVCDTNLARRYLPCYATSYADVPRLCGYAVTRLVTMAKHRKTCTTEVI